MAVGDERGRLAGGVVKDTVIKVGRGKGRFPLSPGVYRQVTGSGVLELWFRLKWFSMVRARISASGLELGLDVHTRRWVWAKRPYLA